MASSENTNAENPALEQSNENKQLEVKNQATGGDETGSKVESGTSTEQEPTDKPAKPADNPPEQTTSAQQLTEPQPQNAIPSPKSAQLPQPSLPTSEISTLPSTKRRAAAQGGAERYGGVDPRAEEENERDAIDPPVMASAEVMARRKIAPMRKRRVGVAGGGGGNAFAAVGGGAGNAFAAPKEGNAFASVPVKSAASDGNANANVNAESVGTTSATAAASGSAVPTVSAGEKVATETSTEQTTTSSSDAAAKEPASTTEEPVRKSTSEAENKAEDAKNNEPASRTESESTSTPA